MSFKQPLCLETGIPCRLTAKRRLVRGTRQPPYTSQVGVLEKSKKAFSLQSSSQVRRRHKRSSWCLANASASQLVNSSVSRVTFPEIRRYRCRRSTQPPIQRYNRAQAVTSHGQQSLLVHVTDGRGPSEESPNRYRENSRHARYPIHITDIHGYGYR